ncbi:MAG: BON domain-containing protein [Thermodesulfobacteriota bacterium]
MLKRFDRKTVGLSASYFLTLIFVIPLLVSFPAGARDITDEKITRAIETRLKNDDGVSTHLIDVKTEDGIVVLTGISDSILAKDRVAEIAETIRGVRSVVNKVEVRTAKRPASEIRNDIKRKLKNNPATNASKIQVEVNDATVTISGEVPSGADKRLAELMAKTVRGVSGVYNRISVVRVETRSDEAIKKDIEQRYVWDVWLNEENIDVAVKDGRVLLSGTVGSPMIKQRALDKAWIIGVDEVVPEKLKVDPAVLDMRVGKKRREVSDEAIKSAIRQAFQYDPRTRNADPEVFVQDGVVRLDGYVERLRIRKTLEDIAWNTVGVISVRNDVQIEPGMIESPDPMVDRDHRLGEKVRAVLRSDPYIPQDQIEVEVNQGGVGLKGIVDSRFIKERATDLISELTGTLIIRNDLRVRNDWKEKEDWKIREDVTDQLMWSPFVSGEEITVLVEDGVVTLKGEVKDLQERRIATKNAMDGGARKVRNLLEVTQPQ